MKWGRVWAIARKESIHIRRDPRSLGMGIAIPMLLLVLFGFALTLDVDRVPLAVWDQDESPLSREFISRFDGSPYFSLKRFVGNYKEIEQAIDSGDVFMALILPRDFGGRIGAGRTAAAQLILDGGDSNTATIALGYAETVTMGFSQKFSLEYAKRTKGRTLFVPLEVRPRVWFNPDMKSRNYIIPGLIAVIMMVIAALLTSLTVAREWETGTMEQLISTPIKGSELIVGKLIPYFAIGMLDVLLAFLLGKYLFQIPFRGSVALLFVMAAVFLAGALSLGLLISNVTKSQLLASQLAMVATFLPSFLLSGFMYAIGNMPPVIQGLTYLIPARYFVALLKGIYLKGIGLEILALEAALLTVFGTAVFVIANKKFQKKMV